MCNRYSITKFYEDYLAFMAFMGMTLVTNGGIPNLEPRDNVRPTDKAPILRQAGDAMELVEVRWGLIPYFHKGAVKEWKLLNTNARAENITSTASYKKAHQTRRCLVPFSHFYEWNGEKGKRTQWKIAPRGDDFHCFAGIWDRADTRDGAMDSFALLTRDAGGTVKDYHDRQPVILSPHECREWLDTGRADFDAFEDLDITPYGPESSSITHAGCCGQFKCAT